MTNQAIIFDESFRLMKAGILKGSGEFINIEDDEGNVSQIELPEPIHTFNGWKERGYQVKKGEKSKIKFPIWKHTSKTVTKDDGEQGESTNMFMKLSAFFTMDQVEKIGG